MIILKLTANLYRYTKEKMGSKNDDVLFIVSVYDDLSLILAINKYHASLLTNKQVPLKKGKISFRNFTK